MEESIDQTKLPEHIAIIMDGNGRWASRQNLSRTQGHIEGVKRVEEIVDEAQRIGIGYLTLFTFSTENWNRPEYEVSMLMQTITSVLQRKVEKLKNDNMRFNIIGRRERIPEPVLKAINYVENQTKNNTGLMINLAFNYGGRIEILDAIKSIAKKVKDGQMNAEDITEETFSDALYTKGIPDPDLLIRTSGEKRISNFLLWQLSYAELYFTDKFWPEFTPDEFKNAIIDFQHRERRFGQVSAPESS